MATDIRGSLVILLFTLVGFAIGASAGHYEGLSKGYERVLGDMQTRTMVGQK